MDKIIINDANIDIKDIKIYEKKVRAILLKDDKILVSHYGGINLLPGGKIDGLENDDEALIRELKEETGIVYDINKLKKVCLIKHYQYNFPTRNNGICNRLIDTLYYIGEYKGIDLANTKRTINEINGNFSLELIDIDDVLKNESNNPRKVFFDRENEEVIKVLRKIK